MIEVPLEVWRPKVIIKYTTPDLEDNDVDDILYYIQYGRCVYKTKSVEQDTNTRTDLIIFDDAIHGEELEKDLNFDDSADKTAQDKMTSILEKYWDCFAKEGATRTVLGYIFGIDTGGSKPVCWRKPLYGH